MQAYIELVSRFPILLLIFLAVICGVSGDIFAKYWSVDHKLSYFLLVLFFYAGSAFFFVPTLLRESLVVISVIWTIMNITGFLLVGLVMFKETLTYWQIMGVLIGIVAVVMLNYNPR